MTSRAAATALISLLALLAGHSADGQPASEPSAELKLYVFDCGQLRFANVTGFSIANDETDIRDLSVPCYMVEHATGRLLWDGGLPSRLAESEGWQGQGMQLRLDRTLGERRSG